MFPYFDILLEKLDQKNETAQEAFGEYVHWGYWNNPRAKFISAKDFHYAAELMTQHVIEKAGIKDGCSILDAGCGFGGTLKFLNEKYNNCNLVGINIDSRQIEITKKRVISKNDNTMEFIEADACAFPFPEKKFDVILCVESIFHFSDRETFFRECRRTLKPGGRLVVSDFVPIHPLGSLMDFMEHSLHLVNKVYGTMRIDISVPKYKNIAKTNDFRVESIENITRHTFPTYEFLKQNFSLHLSKEEKKFRNATLMIELVSKIGLLKYLILSFKKNDNI